MYDYTQEDLDFCSWCEEQCRLSKYGASLLRSRIYTIKQYLSSDELLSGDCYQLASIYRERKGDKRLSRDAKQTDRRAIRCWQEFNRA